MGLAQELYESAGLIYRPTQVQALRAVEEAYLEAVTGGSPRYVLCEAPTGTGKSYIILLMALAAWLEQGHKTVVSTQTHVLQKQIVSKDFPFLRKRLSQVRGFKSKLEKWKAVSIKGHGGFPCLRKIFDLKKIVEAEGDLIVRSTKGEFFLVPRQQIVSLAFQLENGAGETSLSENDPLFELVGSTQEDCAKGECPFYHKDCLYYRNIRQSAPLIIANHALLTGLMDSKDGVIVEADGQNQKTLGMLDAHLYFFDEAHHLLGYKVAGKVLGKISYNVVKSLVQVPVPLMRKDMHEELARLSKSLYEWWIDVCEYSPVKNGRRYKLLLEQGVNLYRRWKKLGRQNTGKFKGILLERCAEFYTLLQQLHGIYKRTLLGEGDVIVAGQQEIILSEAKQKSVKEDLQTACPKIVLGGFLSGTMAIDKSFDAFKIETGIQGDDVRTVQVQSPFSFDNVAVWVPRTVPNPTKDEKFYAGYVAAFCQNYIPPYIERQLGGVLVLCSSLKRMKLVSDTLSEVLPEGKVFTQGAMPKHQLAKAFLFTPSSVLVGSASFREGFDAPKDKLTWVIIDRLPFAPMDNQMSIRLERLKKWENLTNPFKHSLSLMKLFLVQSVGRLIRTEYDRGLITILDPRMWHEKWDLAGCTPKGKEEWFSKLPIIEEWEQALDQIVETKDYTLLKDTPVIVPEAINI